MSSDNNNSRHRDITIEEEACNRTGIFSKNDDSDAESLTSSLRSIGVRQRKFELGEKSPVMSVLEVPDALALRVILQRRKLTADEDNEVTARQEKELCYYVRDLY